ncbi:Glycerol-3-phosphate acyltransferase [Sulfurovum sp. enrichment culture clone C5]|uniref:Glycerol-3-phosphate acyltransferase n=1 Tax=Sulfurovum sp. enrichment culture clone C5 TaxID=497650 RepID=A0A0S4XRK7_9BACT|nr:Glycerol-3-phosphate acyltransferase [Sulfurovum sp. enrichment culture clone C5]
MDFININLFFYILAYLVGGIPFGYILAKKFAGVDVKNAGSGNIGATNVLRVVKETNPNLAKKLGIATLALDAMKGAIIVLIAKVLGLDINVLWTIAVLSVLGHCFSPYLNFEGGKGVATAVGVLFVLLPLPTLVAVVVWFISAKGLKISSLSSLIALIALIVASYVLSPDIAHAPLWIIAWIIFYKHIPNIKRIINKEEEQVI